MTDPDTITETDTPYGPDDRCRLCGAHFAEPHNPGCQYVTEDDLEALEHERAYLTEMAECCGGREPWCGHWTGTSTGYGVTHA